MVELDVRIGDLRQLTKAEVDTDTGECVVWLACLIGLFELSRTSKALG